MAKILLYSHSASGGLGFPSAFIIQSKDGTFPTGSGVLSPDLIIDSDDPIILTGGQLDIQKLKNKHDKSRFTQYKSKLPYFFNCMRHDNFESLI